MVKFACKKLCRDKVLERMKEFDVAVCYKVLDNEGLKLALKQKLIEESDEVSEAQSRNEIITELGDVLEVIDGLCKAYGIFPDEILSAKKASFKERGGFEKGIFVETIEMSEDNQLVKHFRKSPNKYPEV